MRSNTKENDIRTQINDIEGIATLLEIEDEKIASSPASTLTSSSSRPAPRTEITRYQGERGNDRAHYDGGEQE
jgi:hypothetical protein